MEPQATSSYTDDEEVGLGQPLRTLPAVQDTLAGVVGISLDAAVRTGVALAFGEIPTPSEAITAGKSWMLTITDSFLACTFSVRQYHFLLGIPYLCPMNFLAHLLLSYEEEELLIGNFLGDFVRNSELPKLSTGIQRGVQLHRHIDTYTDQHPSVSRGTRLLHVRHRKYAGVVLDIYFDYLLAKHWSRFGSGNLRTFTQDMYAIIGKFLPQFPSRIAKFVPNMIADDWLMKCTAYAGLEETFRRLRKRLSRPEFLDGVVANLQAQEEALEIVFLQFFPDLMQEVRAFSKAHN
ncbi:MAG: DUF479 domain-containing protein [Bacteroidetes bacterium]|nr:MAG: DUF479 domain-containing protein [Bacteroidota bacterium]